VKLPVLVAAALLAGCGNPAGDTKNGHEVFAKMCVQCHGPLGKPDATMVARLNVRDLTSPEFRARVSAGLVENQVRKGSENKLMPSFEGLLNDVQISAVAAYVSNPAFPEQPPGAQPK
jgi:mono/diheme cytochrome c family protein